jgi:hypothetical protein
MTPDQFPAGSVTRLLDPSALTTSWLTQQLCGLA